ncbi:MFS transporter [Robiginitalea sp. M366]|uniref:MFS transporter n=1 Tax=Robiginitalea aestuariiviva TaxID=3036903 RepID=UPI00240D997A|nr:MFS transporter [Robiginitalea aestuariiviva]MDG1572145.1 MFS transporter [Robiginitalea aestuariiviva]
MPGHVAHSANTPPYRPPGYVLPLIVLSQFCGTSLWFASNGIIGELTASFGLPAAALGYLTSAVQLGFIAGTLLFALLTLADRYSPSRLFFGCALLGALANLGLGLGQHTLTSLLLLRFVTGFFLAGIYPVGMKIASDYFGKGLGTSLGYLVGALVLGTALPHLLRWAQIGNSWEGVLWATSGLAALGGMAMAFLPDGPFHRKMQAPEWGAFLQVFRDRQFRASAFGYFGHMWELYAFWAFVPVLLREYAAQSAGWEYSPSLWAFYILGIGGPACVLGGYLSRKWGARAVARTALVASGCCCLLAPFAFSCPPPVFLGFLLFWGMVVIADSPLLSTLVAQSAPADRKGTALTIATSIGFAITIVSIESLSALLQSWDSPLAYLLLAMGPALGVVALGRTPGQS